MEIALSFIIRPIEAGPAASGTLLKSPLYRKISNAANSGARGGVRCSILGWRVLKPEVYLNCNLHRCWLAIFHRCLESELTYRLHRFLIQTHTQRMYNSKLAWHTVRVNNQRDLTRSLKFCFSRLICELRISI